MGFIISKICKKRENEFIFMLFSQQFWGWLAAIQVNLYGILYWYETLTKYMQNEEKVIHEKLIYFIGFTHHQTIKLSHEMNRKPSIYGIEHG